MSNFKLPPAKVEQIPGGVRLTVGQAPVNPEPVKKPCGRMATFQRRPVPPRKPCKCGERSQAVSDMLARHGYHEVKIDPPRD